MPASVAVAAAIYVAAVVQVAVVPYLPLGRLAPDLLALVAVGAALVNRGRLGIAAASASGVMSDLAAQGRLGPAAAWFVLVAVVIQRFVQRPSAGTATCAAAVWTGVLAATAGVGVTRWLLGETSCRLLEIPASAAGAASGTLALAAAGWLAGRWLQTGPRMRAAH